MKLFKNDNLYIDKKMSDGANQKEDQQKEQIAKKVIEAKTIFKPKVDLKNTPLSWRTKFGFSLGHFFNDAVSSVWFCYSLLFFKLYFSNTMAGVLVLVGQVSDAVVTPIIGYFCDRQKCTPDSWFLLRAGKRKFWHIVGTLLLMVIFPLSYTYPLLLENEGSALRTFSLHTVIYTIIIALFQGAWAKVQVSHVSLITDLTSLQNERVALNAYRQAATVLANLLIYVLMLLLLRTSDQDDSAFSKKDAVVVAIVSGISCIIGAIVSIIFYILVKEPGQCLLNKNKRKEERRLALANNILNNTPIAPTIYDRQQSQTQIQRQQQQQQQQTSVDNIEKGLKRLESTSNVTSPLPETILNNIVNSTENTDHVNESNKQISNNNNNENNSLSKEEQKENQEGDTIQELPVIRHDRPKLHHSVSINSTASDLGDGVSGKIYKKKGIGELEKKKSRISLRSMTMPVRRMFSVDARKQFNCKDWLKCVQFWKVAVIYMMARLYYNTTQAYTTLYLTYTLKLSKSSIAIVPFVVYISGFVVSLLVRPISAKIGSRYVLLVGCIFSIVSSVWFNFGDEDNESFKKYQVYGATIFNGIGCTSILISSMAITTDLIGDNKNSGFVFAAMSFLDKLINGLTVYFIELFNPELPSYYQYVLVYAAGSAVIFTLIGLFSIRNSRLGKLDKSNDNMLKELVSKSTPPLH